MASEIRLSGTLQFTKSSESATISGSFTADQSGNHYMNDTQSVGTAEEQLDKGDIGTIGYIGFKNLDSTNYVQLGISTGAYTLKFKAGEFGVFPWSSSTAPYVKANTGACIVEYVLIEA